MAATSKLMVSGIRVVPGEYTSQPWDWFTKPASGHPPDSSVRSRSENNKCRLQSNRNQSRQERQENSPGLQCWESSSRKINSRRDDRQLSRMESWTSSRFHRASLPSNVTLHPNRLLCFFPPPPISGSPRQSTTRSQPEIDLCVTAKDGADHGCGASDGVGRG